MLGILEAVRIVAVLLALTTAQKGLSRLTSETYEEAIACGRAGAACAVTPYLLCPSPTSRFSSYIATPFSRVASAVLEATKAGLPIRPMSPGEANGWGVGIYVFPGNNQRLADSIQKVTIKRGDTVIEPSTATIAPAVYRGKGAPPLSKGFFSFPMDTFAPTSSITVVLTGTFETMYCSLDRAQLETLR